MSILLSWQLKAHQDERERERNRQTERDRDDAGALQSEEDEEKEEKEETEEEKEEEEKEKEVEVRMVLGKNSQESMSRYICAVKSLYTDFSEFPFLLFVRHGLTATPQARRV